MELTDNQARLRDALPGPAQPGATPAELADATGLAYSTVTRLLRELRDLAVAVRDDEAGIWHTATGSNAAEPDTAADQLAEPVPDVDEDATAAPADADVHDADPTTDDEPAEPQAPTHDDADQETDHEALTPEPSPDAPARTGPERLAASKTRLGKGELRDMVLAALVNAGAPLGPTELSRLLDGRSQGAITNACDKLAGAGLIVQTSEHPRRWAATGTPAETGTAA